MSAPLCLLGQAPLTRDEVLARLPPCYTPELNECIEEAKASAEAGTTAFAARTPRCAEWIKIRGYPDFTPAWDAAIEAIPYCPEPREPESSLVPAAAALALGFVIGAVLV